MPYKAIAAFPQAKAIFFRTALAKIATAIERRRVRAVLGRLDDHLLKDMGIARSDIERIANRTYPTR